MRWTKKHRADLDKELHYVLALSKYTVEVEYPDGEVAKHPSPSKVVVSDNFFRSVRCKMCRRCCWSFNKFWTEREFAALERMYPELVGAVSWRDVSVKVDGQRVLFKMLPETKEIGCPFLSRVKGCLVHQLNPVHCRVPLIKFKSSRGVTRITKEQFGRNWAFHCQMQYGPLERGEFEGWDLEVMSRVGDLADDLGVVTHLDWVVRELRRRYKAPLRSAKVRDL